MKPAGPLVVDVSSLLEHPGSRRSLRFEAAVEGLELQMVRIDPRRPLSFGLGLESVEEGIVVRGTISGRSTVTCRRCLEEVERPFAVEVAEVYRRAGDVWEEEYVIVGQTVDLEPLVRDNVLGDLPLHPLCREDCLGLCARCGGNRNRGECACPTEEGDRRWQALRELGGGER